MEDSVTFLYIIVSILYIIFTYCMYIIGWSDIELFTILKTGTMLSIRYIFESKAQKSANLAARAAHGRQSFIFLHRMDLTVLLENFQIPSFYFYFKEQTSERKLIFV